MAEQHENWMNPLNKIIWQKAFKAGAKSATLRDGRKFKIRYISNPFYSKGEKAGDHKVALVTPARGFVPMGYFRMTKVTDKHWITEPEREVKVGMYDRFLGEFLRNGGTVGIDVVAKWPELEGKSVATLRSGFQKAITANRGARNVEVMSREGTVYLLKNAKAD